MNSQQERALFTQYGWEYNYVTRTWTAPNGRMMTLDQIMGVTGDRVGDLTLMRLIVEHGKKVLE